MHLHTRSGVIDVTPHEAAVVMGILNVTPDSFSDGGRYLDPELAARRASTMLDEGAAIIDVGGASSRPAGSAYGAGAQSVSADEEIDRVLPAIKAILESRPEAVISVDTFRPSVAEAALSTGASIVNDITGLRAFPELADVAAAHEAPIILMHSVGLPGAMPHVATYSDVLVEVMAGLTASVNLAEEAGVADIVVDPGFGFGKSVDDNLRLIARTDSLLRLGRPVLVGVSRKSSIGSALGSPGDPVPVEERLFGSLGAMAVAVIRGASIVRTHDVAETVQMLKLVSATRNAERLTDSI